MKLKGKTIIELTDVHTGEKQTFEDHNMVTNALNEFFNNGMFGLLNNASGDLSGMQEVEWYVPFFVPLFKRLLGGVLLFEDAIPEDVNQLYAPADAKNIGYASIDAYGGSNSFRGNWNDAESGEVEGGTGYKFVWDFGTDKANGLISCVSLTTPFGGRFGYGVDINSNMVECAVPNCNMKLTPSSDPSSNNFKIGPFLMTSERIYRNSFKQDYTRSANGAIGWQIDTDDGSTFTVTKYDCASNRVSIVKSPNEAYELESNSISTTLFYDNAAKIANGASTMASDPWKFIECDFDFYNTDNENGYAYIYTWARYGGTTVAFQNLYVIKINLDDCSVVFSKSIALTGVLASQYGQVINAGRRLAVVSQDKMYFYHYNGTYNNITGTTRDLIKLDLNNPTDIKKIRLPIPENTTNLPVCYYSTGYESYVGISKIKGRILTPCHIIDQNGNVLLYPIPYSNNTASVSVYAYFCANPFPESNDASVFSQRRISAPASVSTNYDGITFYTPCLFTINNLDTPVTKTADKTMKITYVLTEGAGE